MASTGECALLATPADPSSALPTISTADEPTRANVKSIPGSGEMSGAIVTAVEPTRANVKSLPGPDGDGLCHGVSRVDQFDHVYGNLQHCHDVFEVDQFDHVFGNLHTNNEDNSYDIDELCDTDLYHTSLVTRGSVSDLDMPAYSARSGWGTTFVLDSAIDGCLPVIPSFPFAPEPAVFDAAPCCHDSLVDDRVGDANDRVPSCSSIPFVPPFPFVSSTNDEGTGTAVGVGISAPKVKGVPRSDCCVQDARIGLRHLVVWLQRNASMAARL
jgi:hypothetical protein